jgi:hypothetical protein
MSPTILSPTAFDWFLSALTGVIAGIWFVWDAIKLYNLRAADGSDPVIGDKRFGYAMGVVIGGLGITGVLYHHLGHHLGHLGHHLG